METNYRARDDGAPSPSVCSECKTSSPPLLEPSLSTDRGKALSSIAIYIILCPLGVTMALQIMEEHNSMEM